MSKGLEALEELKNLCKKNCTNCMRPQVMNFCEEYCYHKHVGIIEKELKEYEEHEQLLEEYGLNLVDFRQACFLFVQWRWSNWSYPKIKKQLKVLEIIKNKNVCIELLKDCSNAEEYNDICGYHHSHSNSNYKVLSLTDEEFKLLKEVLDK